MRVRSNSIVCIVLAGTLGAGCQLLVTFETIDEGGGGTGGATTMTTGGGTTTTTTSTEPETCTNALECDDSNPCTADDCPGGVCTHTPVNEGMALSGLDV